MAADELAAFAPSTLTQVGNAHSVNPFTGAPSSSFAYLSGGVVEGGVGGGEGGGGGVSGARDEVAVGKGGGEPMWYTRGEHGLAGLRNQGATCYLNSLLQALFHTIGFRNALLAWVPGRDATPRPVAEALRALFARMVASDQAALSTVELTDSFGWTSGEAFRQHDVQELLRVLFSVLDHVGLPGRKGVSVVDALYRGSLRDAIVCQACGYASVRDDAFLDVSLFMDASITTLDAALASFVAKEHLTGANQYACSGCGTKTDATKGLAFDTLPPILSLQLKRFVYDWDTNRRVKLDQRLEFPLTLDMAPYMADAPDAPVLYEAYAILLHTGSAHSGHYFAFVKDAETGVWYEFNDSSVRALDDLDAALDVAYGTAGARRSGSAYLLQYRALPLDASAPVDLAPDLAAAVAAEDAAWRAEVEALVKEHRTMRFTAVCGGECAHVALDQGATVADLRAAAAAALGVDALLPSRLRLRTYTYVNGRAGMAGEVLDSDDEAAARVLASVRARLTPTLVVETREADAAFEPFDPDAFLVLVVGVTAANAAEVVAATREPDIDAAARCWLRTGMTYDEAAGALAAAAGVGESGDVAVFTVGHDSLVCVSALAGGGGDVESLGMRAGTVVYVEGVERGEESAFAAHFEAQRCAIKLVYNTPVGEEAKVDGEVAYEHAITFSKHRTLGELKVAVAAALGRDVASFSMARSAAEAQLRDMGMSVARANLFDEAPLFLREGRPLGVSEAQIKLVVYDPLHKSGRMMWPLAPKFVVDTSVPAADVCAEIKAMLDAEHPPTEKTLAVWPGATNKFGIEHMRLRAVSGSGKVGKVVAKRKSLSTQVRVEAKTCLAVQRVDAEEELGPGAVIFFTQLGADGALVPGTRIEHVATRTTAASSVIERALAGSGLDVQHAAVAVALSFAETKSEERLLKLKWRPARALKATATIGGPPLNVTDGSVVVFYAGAALKAARAAAGVGAKRRPPRGRRGGGTGGGGSDIVFVGGGRRPVRVHEVALTISPTESGGSSQASSPGGSAGGGEPREAAADES